MFAIHNDVPLPAAKVAGHPITKKYPLGDLEVGDSFFIPVTDDANLRRTAFRAYYVVQDFRRRRGRHYRFAVRRLGDRVGVWRVPDRPRAGAPKSSAVN
jgi:hypothetical protein